tara:strand:+ start:47 stop:373 length:327 start_codon:yes stop_codon:yes gene_type:complete
MPKYKNERIARLNTPEYATIFEDKGVKFVDIRRTITFESLKNLRIPVRTKHVWSYGNTLYRLSYLYYGTYDFWWVIGIVNNKPTDAHYEYGDEVIIPEDPYIVANSME